MKPAVLICCFNRPDATRRVLQAVREFAPDRLYVSCDGPRERAGEAERVAEVRALVDDPGWTCRVERRFLSANEGCASAIHGALEWFFSREETGIVLEDDTVPSKAFFQFCSEGLERLRDDRRVFGLTGNNLLPQGARSHQQSDVSLTRYFLCWGWASWRDRLAGFRLSADAWDEVKFRSHSEAEKLGAFERDFWAARFRMAYAGQYPGWATKLLHQSWMKDGLWVTPACELVSNIGFGQDATHTVGGRRTLGFESDPSPLVWPIELNQDEILEALRFLNIFNRDWAGVGNLLAEKEIYNRMIAYKKQVFELQAVLASPIAAGQAAFRAAASAFFRRIGVR